MHVAGRVASEDGVFDAEHGLFSPQALQLVRSTEAYQWSEERSERRTRLSHGETKVDVEYKYRLKWTSRPIDSAGFESGRHRNPYPKLALGRRKMTVNDATLPNGLRVPAPLVDQITSRNSVFALGGIDRTTPIPLDGGGVELAYNDGVVISRDTLYFPESSRLLALPSAGSEASPHQVATTGKKQAVLRHAPEPVLGDVRVSWREVTPPREGVSVLAKQQGDTLVPWVHDQGHQVYRLSAGEVPPQSMINEMIHTHRRLTKWLRIGGWAGAFLGLNWSLSCIPALLRWLPLGVGGVLAPLAQITTSTVAFGASLGLSAAVAGLAWLRFRPLLATGLALVSGSGFLGPLFYARRSRSPEVRAMDERLSEGTTS